MTEEQELLERLDEIGKKLEEYENLSEMGLTNDRIRKLDETIDDVKELNTKLEEYVKESESK